MVRRYELHEKICDILGSRNVYFQAPSTLKMKYPCVRYDLSGFDTKHANDGVYNYSKRYDGVIIDLDPDTEIPEKMLMAFSFFSLGKPYIADGLYHYPFTLYF